ncbi:MAG: hypothetical protein K5866_04255 [Treponema sp.]|nr:hypothetical protein [Treponema sp.]
MENATYNAMTLSEDNPLYKKYLKKKDLTIKRMRRGSKKVTSDSIERSELPEDYNPDEFYYVSFITRKYFVDHVLISLAKLAFGILALILAMLMEDVIPINGRVKGLFMSVTLFYAIIMIPLSLLYIITSLICLINYKSYISTSTSLMAKKIIKFYDPENDMFQEVNWRNIFTKGLRDKEKRKVRGW